MVMNRGDDRPNSATAAAISTRTDGRATRGLVTGSAESGFSLHFVGMKPFRRLDPGRSRSRWAGPGLLRHRFPRFLLPLVSRSQRSPAHRDGDAAQARCCCTTRSWRRLGSVLGCLALYYVARKGGEAFLRKRFKRAPRRSGHAALPEVRPPRRDRPGAAAAAGAVQDLRAARRRRRDSRSGSSSSPISIARVHPLRRRRAAGGLVRRRGERLPARRTPRRSASWLAGLALVLGVGSPGSGALRREGESAV